MKVTEYRVEVPNRLVKARSVEYGGNGKIIQAEQAVELMNEAYALGSLAEEHVYMAALNANCELLGLFEVSHGGVTGALISPREIYIRALLAGASGVIMMHNHPSGSTQPSKEDDKLTKNIGKAGELIGIHLLDHIIVTGDKYYSYGEHGKA